MPPILSIAVSLGRYMGASGLPRLPSSGVCEAMYEAMIESRLNELSMIHLLFHLLLCQMWLIAAPNIVVRSNLQLHV